jgi:lipopolysaccharide export LptBFGC system permease protein LptF
MGQSQEVDGMNLTRPMIAGMGLAVLAVGLFLVLWFALGGAGLANAPRLFASLCLPPVIVGGVLAAWILLRRPRDSGSS